MIAKFFDRIIDYFIIASEDGEASTSDKVWFYGFYVIIFAVIIITFSLIIF